MKSINIKLVLVLMLIAIIFTGCTSNKKTLNKEDNEFTIVTSFYPIYIETLNVVHDIPNVKVVNMTKAQTGCLHDYALTTGDLKTIENADVLIVNGAGMEAFLDKVISEQPNLKIVDASKGIELIKNNYEEGDNPHVWVSVTNGIQQIKNIESELETIDTVNAEKYKANADEYIVKLENLKTEMHNELDGIKDKDIVTFHEAFPYFAKEFNLNIVATIEREPGSEPTPKELEETINIVKQSGIKALFAEPQYSAKAAETIAVETGAKVYTLDPGVTGDDTMDSYINMMRENIKTIKEALK